MDAVVGESQITYDARGLVEVDDTVLGVAVVKDGKATIDASELTTRKINLEIRSLVYEQGIEDVTILNPGGKHSLGVGILTRCKMTFEGSLGYFALGVIDGPEVTVNGRVGWSACENMMAGVIWTNTFNKFDPTSPFGGYKESGWGREGGRHGLFAYLKGVSHE